MASLTKRRQLGLWMHLPSFTAVSGPLLAWMSRSNTHLCLVLYISILLHMGLSWTLLVALALYDLVAVLAPGGPLKLLVELASSRDGELPALVYEARPVVSEDSGNRGGSTGLNLLVGGVSDSGSVELQMVSSNDESRNQSGGVDYTSIQVESDEIEMVRDEGETSPLVPSSWERGGSGNDGRNVASVREEMSPLVELLGMEDSAGEARRNVLDDDVTVSGGIKLGLGDFIFYSVLVGRAAMYDLMTVYACYLGIYLVLVAVLFC